MDLQKDQTMSRSFPSVAVLAAGVLCAAVTASAVGFIETFATDPADRGWFSSGSSNLFTWDGSIGAVHATWDSRAGNQYYARSLGVELSRTNDFCLVFDLNLADFTPGIDTNKNLSSFQLAVGLIRLADATAPGFHRGSGDESPNLCDFSFFPDPGGDWQWGSSLTSALCDTTGSHWTTNGFLGVALTPGDTFRVTMAYHSGEDTLRTEVLRNGEPWQVIPPAGLSDKFTDFRLDHVAICSYGDAGQFPGYEGSLLAHGLVDTVAFLPALPVSEIHAISGPGGMGVGFSGFAGWKYTLERRGDGGAWQPVAASMAATDGPQTLVDAVPAGVPLRVYRVKAALP